MDPFSPFAGAHVRALVLPVGSIARSRFALVVHRLQREASIVPLADVALHSPDDAHFLSPKPFPQASLLYRFLPSVPSETQQQLSPYELFREPLLVIGVLDGLEGDDDARRKLLDEASAHLKERHSRVVHRQLLVLGGEGGGGERIVREVVVPDIDSHNEPSLRAAVCEISARFLVEFTTYAKALQASPSIQTPGQTARALQRNSFHRDGDKRLSSGMSSPADEEGPAKAPPLPATSFDQMPGANVVTNALERSDSRGSSQSGGSKGKGHTRTSSHDRIALQGFGSGTSQEKLRARGKSRVGIVLGSVYMMAGRWSDALPILVEHTTKARTLSDHLWHAKGLENSMLCMLLLAWAGVDFQVPSICDPITERTGSSTIARASIDARLAAEGMQRQIVRLSVAIPDLSKLILSLYRSHEGALELPAIVPAEATVRVAKLLAVLGAAGGELEPASIGRMITGRNDSNKVQHSAQSAPMPLGRPRPYSRIVIAELLAQALPANDDGMAVADHIQLLAGIAASYGALGLVRKKAITLKDLITRLTQALLQARKLGAAEMGIHPAAALSVESGPDSSLDSGEESSGLHDLFHELALTYGADITMASPTNVPTYVDTKAHGNGLLKRDLLKELAHFCEASPDPLGVISLTASLLRAAGPNSAIDAGTSSIENAFSREEQMHYATVINRTVAMSRHLGFTDIFAEYWDPFLVRLVQILQPSGQRAVIDRTKLNVAQKSSDQPIAPGNPLLYDPSASRPGTAALETFLLVANEASVCRVTLQNPFDIPVDIESMQLVAEGGELESSLPPTTLGPLRFQQVALTVTPKTVGTMKITGCRIQMRGCYPQDFSIVSAPWATRAPLTLKDIHDGSRNTTSQSDGQESALNALGIKVDHVSATVIEELPSLVLENTAALESGLMLLQGESRSLELILRNTGSIAATVFEATDTADVLRRDDEHKLKLRGVKHKRSKSFLPTTTIAPGECTTFKFRVEGKAGLSSTQANFYYQASSGSDVKHARVVSVPVVMTVNAALQVHNLEVSQLDDIKNGDNLLVSFDLRNAWPQSVHYECFEKAARRLEWNRDAADVAQDIRDGHLAPGEIRRVYLSWRHDWSTFDFEEDAETARRRFLDQLHVSWHVEEHSGYVDLLDLPLSSRALDLARGWPVSVDLSASHPRHQPTDLPPTVSSEETFHVGAYITIAVRIKSRSRRTGHLCVELLSQDQDSRRFAVAGNLKRVLPPFDVGVEMTAEFVVCPLLAGKLEFDAIVRPVQLERHVEQKGWNAIRSIVLDVHGRGTAEAPVLQAE